MRAFAGLLGLASSLTLLALAACQPKLSTEIREVREPRWFCASSTGPGAGETSALTVDVDFQTCMSSSCDTLRVSTCTLSVDEAERTVTLETLARVESVVGGDCTADCHQVSAQCSVELAEAAGSYAIVSAATGLRLDYELGQARACTPGG